MRTVKHLQNTYKIPESLDEISVKDYYRIHKRWNECKTDLDLTCLLLDIDHDLGYYMPEIDFNFLLDDLPQVLDDNGNAIKKNIPNHIKVEGKKYRIPKDLLKITLKQGQLELFRNITIKIDNKYRDAEIQKIQIEQNVGNKITDEQSEKYKEYLTKCFEDRIFVIHKLTAVILKDSLKRDEWESFAEKLLDLPITQIYPIGFFLILKYDAWLISLINVLHVRQSLNGYLTQKTGKQKTQDMHNSVIPM
jgi:hypothetical protein